jgi:2-polyprenyl-3-methyl-5-hydroxy-6-metoxy-1,4-benzoquinol methylase
MPAEPTSRRPAPAFDSLAELFERFAQITDDFYRPWLTSVIPDRSGQGSRAADLGCGSGRFAELLADRYDQVLAVDVAERGLEIARAKRRRDNISYECRSLLDVTAERDGRFDLVLCVNTIHNVSDPEPVLSHIRGLVAPGGHAVIVDIVRPYAWSNTRWWQYVDAAGLAAGTLVRRHSLGDALAVLRLRWHPAWIEKVTKQNATLRRAEFRQRYGPTFPGATFADLRPVVCAMAWPAATKQ